MTSRRPRAAALAALLLALTGARPGGAAETLVAGDAELRDALSHLGPGSVVVLASGEYRGGIALRGAAGTEKAPIVIRGADPKRPPVFVGGTTAMQLSDCSWIEIRSIAVKGATGNGLNIDDGGSFDTPSHHVTVQDVSISDIGPRGNHDGLKMSGVDRFTVRNCRFEGWGGSAIDMVGCHDGVVEDCVFRGKAGYSQDSGVQMKGGTADVLVQTCLFDQAGERAVNLGGSTGLEFFRPKPGEFEAMRITVGGNRFLGSSAPVAFVGADAGRVVRNTFVRPGKWVLRILQEQRAPGFLPCRGGVFEENLVVTDEKVATFVNVGDATAPETFTFRRNAWFREGPAARPQLPVAEKDGIHGVDPKLDETGPPAWRVTSRDPALRGIGADAWERRR